MLLIENIIKPSIKQLTRNSDSFDDRFDYLCLDKNERLLPFPANDLESLRRTISSIELSGYYELGSLYRKLAKTLGANENQLLLAAGADLAIKSVFEACVGAGDNVVLHAPSYAMYGVYTRMFGAEQKTVSILPDWSVDVEGMLSAVNNRTKLMVLENPNGFVGTMPPPETIEYAAKMLLKRNVLLLLDEAYYYVEHSDCANLALIAKYPNVVLAQTFSKAHGLAGARFAYLVSDSRLMSYVSRVRPMHEISSLAGVAAHWLLDRPYLITEFQESICESKAYLFKELTRLNVFARDTHTNFLLLYFPDEGRTRKIKNRLEKEMILIRRPFSENILRGWSRVCVGNLDDSKRFITSLDKLLNEDNYA